jgi:hypothetical protein
MKIERKSLLVLGETTPKAQCIYDVVSVAPVADLEITGIGG